MTRLNATTERFARQSRDRRPFPPEKATLGERVAMVVSIIGALVVIALLFLENGAPLP